MECDCLDFVRYGFQVGEADHRQACPLHRVTAAEYWGKGDPYFGGRADDRPLGKSGSFLTGSYSRNQIATFATRAEAIEAAERAPNRRADGLLGAS